MVLPYSRLSHLFLFLLVLQASLWAWPGIEKASTENIPTFQEKRTIAEMPDNVQSRGPIDSDEVPRESQQVESPENSLLQPNSDVENNFSFLSHNYSMVTKQKLAESLGQLRLNHPDIAEEIQTWRADDFSYDALQELKKRMRKALPISQEEIFQATLKEAQERKTKAMDCLKKSGELLNGQSQYFEGVKLHDEACLLRTLAYARREKYLETQLQLIRMIGRIHYVIETKRSAREIADKLQPEISCLNSFLNLIFTRDPGAAELLVKFNNASSIQEQAEILNKIKEIDFPLDSDLEKLAQNLENKKQLIRLLETFISKKPDALPTTVFHQIFFLEKFLPYVEPELPRTPTIISELESSKPQFSCANTALKFKRAYSLKLKASTESGLDANKKFIELIEQKKEPELVAKLEYMSLFLDLLGKRKWLPVRNVEYQFLKQANIFIEDYLLNLSTSNKGEFLPVIRKREDRGFIERIDCKTPGRLLASIMELTRARRDYQNQKVVKYHVQAALFLMKSAHEFHKQGSETPLSSLFRRVGEIFALAAYRERQQKSHFTFEDDMMAEDYARQASKLLAGEECSLMSHKPYFGNLALRESEVRFYRCHLEERLNLPVTLYGRRFGGSINEGTEDPIFTE